MRMFLFALSSLLLVALLSGFAYAGGTINSGKPVPFIQYDTVSAEFLAKLTKKNYGGDEEDWLPYSWRLAKTLSQLSAAEQNEIWYGP